MSDYQKEADARCVRRLEELFYESEDACIGTLDGIERLLGSGNFRKIEPRLHGLMRASYQRGVVMGKLEFIANRGMSE